MAAFLVDLDELSEAVDALVPITKARTPKEILKRIRLRIDDQQLWLAATDMEVFAEIPVPAETQTASGLTDCTVDAALLQSICKRADSGTASANIEESSFHLAIERSTFKADTQDAAEFPGGPKQGTELASFEVDPFVLTSAIRPASLYVDKANSRPAFEGVMFDRGDDGLFVVGCRGTDAIATEVSVECQSEFKVSVPVSGCRAITSLFAAAGQPISITFYEHCLIATGNQKSVASRLIEGRVPKWRDVVFAEGDVTFEANAGQLKRCLEQVNVMADEFTAGAEMRLTGDEATFSIENSQRGEAFAALPADTPEARTISIFPSRILPATRQFGDDDTLKCSLSDRAFKIEHGLVTYCSGVAE